MAVPQRERHSVQLKRQSYGQKLGKASETPLDIATTAQVAAPRSSPTVAPPTTKASAPLVLEFADVIAAVESLCEDELKPFGRILRKRVAERALAAQNVREAQAEGGGAAASAQKVVAADVQKSEVAFGEDAASRCEVLPNVDMKRLRAVCDACPALYVECEDGGDWSALLVGRKPTFIDVYDPKDVYSEELWTEVSKYFTGLAGTTSQFLPGGRYSCAQALVARQPSFVSGLSMGRVCHIVQLAISQKKVLGYLDGAVVPYVCSQSMMKEQRAEKQLPCSNGADEQELPFASLTEARTYLKAILEKESSSSSNRGNCMVPLSNIKRLFRSRFKLELSETMLGHSKLSELLQDERFVDVCTVKLAGHGYFVVPNETTCDQTSPAYASMSAPPGLPAPEASGPPGLLMPAEGADQPKRVVISPPRLEENIGMPPGLEGIGMQHEGLAQKMRHAAQLAAAQSMYSSMSDKHADIMPPSFIEGKPAAPGLGPQFPTLLAGGRRFQSGSKFSDDSNSLKLCPDSHCVSTKGMRMLEQQQDESRALQQQMLLQVQKQRVQHQRELAHYRALEQQMLNQQYVEDQYIQHMQLKHLVQRGVDPNVAHNLVSRQSSSCSQIAATNVSQLEPAFLAVLSDPSGTACEVASQSMELLPR